MNCINIINTKLYRHHVIRQTDEEQNDRQIIFVLRLPLGFCRKFLHVLRNISISLIPNLNVLIRTHFLALYSSANHFSIRTAVSLYRNRLHHRRMFRGIQMRQPTSELSSTFLHPGRVPDFANHRRKGI